MKTELPSRLSALVLVLIFLILIWGGVWYWKQNQELVATSQPTSYVAVSPTLSSTPDTSQWKTWANTEHGFQVKYPADWILKTGSGPVIGDLQNRPFELLGDVNDISLQFVSNPIEGQNALTLRDMWTGESTNELSYENSEVAINGQNMHLLKKTNRQPYEGSPGTSYTYLFDHKNKTYQITLTHHIDAPKDLVTTAQQILSTFKLTK